MNDPKGDFGAGCDDESGQYWSDPTTATPRHTPAFYEALKMAIADPECNSCGYFGYGDFFTIEIIALEQVKRAKNTGKLPGEVFPIALNCEDFYDPKPWSAEFIFYSEGMSRQRDLLINDYPGEFRVVSFFSGRPFTTKVVITSTEQILKLAIAQKGDGFTRFDLNPATYMSDLRAQRLMDENNDFD